MERDLMTSLVAWRESPRRKPLLLRGVRQCGKTWLLKEFGRRYFQTTAYLSFDENPEYAQFFETKDVERIAHNLSLALGKPIVPGASLLILDEVQACPAALNSLKYFNENAPGLHVAAAGSLTGSGFPVGQVDFRHLGPLSFSEFLAAHGDTGLLEFSQTTGIEPLPDAFLNPLQERLQAYMVTGGLPEPVAIWMETRDTAAVDDALWAIIQSYELDFAKHAKPSDFPKISLVWGSLPSQLSRENKKFLYQSVKPGARAREYEDALQWLVQAELVTKVYRSNGPGLPVSAYDDLAAFKIYAGDVGVLRRLARLDARVFASPSAMFTEFRGAMAENLVLQALQPQFTSPPRYWSQNNPPLEVDFLVQHRDIIVPIEVKSGTAVKSRSLAAFERRFPQAVQLRVRFSQQNLRLDGDMLNIPLPLADQASRLIDVVRHQ